MCQLRELSDHNYGLYLVLALALLTALKLANPWRLNSMMCFWVGIGKIEELNKPFNLSKRVSILTFVLRSLIFGLIVRVFQNKSFSTLSFDQEVLYYAGGFMVFWILKTFLEGSFMSFFNRQEAFFRIVHIRSLNKEKLTFLYGCLLFGLAFGGFGEIPSIVFASGYAIAVLAIHLNMIKLYFKHLNVMPVYIILYICTSEIAPIWLVLHILKF
jgi:hypothetical protein